MSPALHQRKQKMTCDDCDDVLNGSFFVDLDVAGVMF